MNILLIVDPQIDFVSGSLPVPGAPKAMGRLAQWIDTHPDRYDAIAITMDQHPADHCSFVTYGGQWPPHCVRYSMGAAIEPCVMEAVERARLRGISVHFVEKATETQRDAYSAFVQDIPDYLLEAEHIFIAGLAGDVCVDSTEQDLLRLIPQTRIERLEEGIAYINPERTCYP